MDPVVPVEHARSAGGASAPPRLRALLESVRTPSGAYVACGLVAAAVFFSLPHGLFQDTIWYPLIGFSSVVAIVAGVLWHRPARPLPWLLFAAGQLLFVIGDVLFGVYEHVLHESPFPSVADYFYLLGYPVLAAGLWLLVRHRSSRRDWATLIDAAILTIALAVPVWVFLMLPYANDSTLSLTEKLYSIAYPLGDVLLLAVAARLVVAGGELTTSYALVVLAVLGLLCADAAYVVLSLQDAYESGNALDLGWILSYLLWGAAALHPSMRAVSEPAPETAPKLTPPRLALLAAVALAAPVVLAFRSSGVAVAGSALLFLLVVARLAGIVARHERAVEREPRLRAAAALFVAATSAEEIQRAAVDTAVSFAGGAPAGASLTVETPAGPKQAAAAGAPAGQNAVEAVFPLVVHDEPLGSLAVCTAAPLAPEQRDALETLAAQAALALESAALTRRQAELRSEAHFRSLVRNSSDVISIVDPDTTVRWVTPWAETSFGYDAAELVGTRLAALVHDEDVARLLAACSDAAASGELQRGLELRLRDRDGTWLDTETVVNPRLDDEDVGGLVLTTRDVTMRKQLEAEHAERERVRDVFSRFVPAAVVEQLLEHGDLRLRLGGDTLHGTIMFTDLRGFTSFSESLPAEEVIEVINQFLSEQTDTIMNHGSTLADSTRATLPADPDDLVEVGEFDIRGRHAGVRLFS